MYLAHASPKPKHPAEIASTGCLHIEPLSGLSGSNQPTHCDVAENVSVSPLDSPGYVAAGYCHYFFDAHEVKVTVERVRHRRRRYCEVENLSRAPALLVQTVNHASTERITTANTVDNANVVLVAKKNLIAIEVDCAPTVIVGRVTFTKRDCNLLEPVLVDEILDNRSIRVGVNLACGHIDTLGGNTKALFSIFLVADRNIDMLHHRNHRSLRLFSAPQVAAVVHVSAYGQAKLLGGRGCFIACCSGGFRDSRGDSGEVEPVLASEYLLPVDLAGLDLSDRRSRTVV